MHILKDYLVMVIVTVNPHRIVKMVDTYLIKKENLNLEEEKMGSAYKTENHEHPVCKVTPSELLKKPREIKVRNATIRKTYPLVKSNTCWIGINETYEGHKQCIKKYRSILRSKKSWKRCGL